LPVRGMSGIDHAAGPATMRAQPGAQQRPEAFHGIDVDLATLVTVLAARILAATVADHIRSYGKAAFCGRHPGRHAGNPTRGFHPPAQRAGRKSLFASLRPALNDLLGDLGQIRPDNARLRQRDQGQGRIAGPRDQRGRAPRLLGAQYVPGMRRDQA